MSYPTPLIPSGSDDFHDLQRTFRWQIPTYFNIAEAICDRHQARSESIALYWEDAAGATAQYSFAQLISLSNRLANALRGLGVQAGDRVAIILPQRIEAALCHLAAWKVGAISLPLSILFGADALKFRLADSGARVVVTTGPAFERVEALRSDLPALDKVIDCGRQKGGFWDLLERASDTLQRHQTRSDDPAVLIYTSGTTGPPKGALNAHRWLFGNLTGFELSHDLFPKPGDCFWTPADWAWAGGLMDALVPSWFYGCPVLGYDGGRFDPERACWLLEKYRVRNAFIPPTALKMIRQLDHLDHFDLMLRSVMSAGETVGSQLYHWAEEELHVCINEMWGQTEFNYAVGNSSAMMPTVPGAMGKPYPGHQVVPLSESGEYLADGVVGELCAWRDDPVMFLGYWNRDAATREKFLGNWWRSGDMGYRDSDGYLWFVGRGDDVISSAGYRIGPGEIEDCLLKHSAVAQAAAIGSPDALRGEIVKAFIVLAHGYVSSNGLREDIQNTVRDKLAAYEYPREIEFVEELPMTTTGKVRRVELREAERRRKRKID
ncbi:MAG: AMP-binding protein [Pseudomonadota bacterium]|nr:AMP-binding protein [Pseudomonadota bacterium]